LKIIYSLVSIPIM